ncbi:hypothetical protein CgunFtcFv8_001980 [Champsocephalus gunnari]|uniref:Uncharacterized protein n=1 Tax=Champsocephalus gunnari TaxID=52237 RepID=A0AAN8CLN2_CHAGU|nr:hypothetical protein CgunFtcFv8_001980 [Champsocephalus gunnari]
MSVPVSVYQQLLFLPPPIRTPSLPSTPPLPPLLPDSPKCCVLSPSLHTEKEVGTGPWSTAATTSIASEG